MPISEKALNAVPVTLRRAAHDAANAGDQVGIELFNYMHAKKHDNAANLIATVSRKAATESGGSHYTYPHANKLFFWVGLLQGYLDKAHPGHVVNVRTPVSEIRKTLGGIVSDHKTHGVAKVSHEHITKHEKDANPVVITPARMAAEQKAADEKLPVIPKASAAKVEEVPEPTFEAPKAASKVKITPVNRAGRSNIVYANPRDPSKKDQRRITPLALAAETIANGKATTAEVGNAISVLLSEACDKHGINNKSTNADREKACLSMFTEAFGKDGPIIYRGVKDLEFLKPPMDWFNADASLKPEIQDKLAMGKFGSMFSYEGKAPDRIAPKPFAEVTKEDPEDDEHEEHAPEQESDEEPEEDQEEGQEEQEDDDEGRELVKHEPGLPKRLRDLPGNKPGYIKGPNGQLIRKVGTKKLKGYDDDEVPEDEQEDDDYKALFEKANNSAQSIFGSLFPAPMSEKEQSEKLAPARGVKEHIVRAISRQRRRNFDHRFEKNLKRAAYKHQLKKARLEEEADELQWTIKNNARYGYFHPKHDDSYMPLWKRCIRRALVPTLDALKSKHLIRRSMVMRGMLMMLAAAIVMPILITAA